MSVPLGSGVGGLGRRWLVLACGLTALWECGRDLATPSPTDPGSWAGWATARLPVEVAMSVIRLAALLVGGYLLVVVTVALIGGLAAHRGTTAFAARLAPRALRSILAVGVTATVAGSLAGTVSAIVAGPVAEAAPIGPPSAGPATGPPTAGTPTAGAATAGTPTAGAAGAPSLRWVGPPATGAVAEPAAPELRYVAPPPPSAPQAPTSDSPSPASAPSATSAPPQPTRAGPASGPSSGLRPTAATVRPVISRPAVGPPTPGPAAPDQHRRHAARPRADRPAAASSAAVLRGASSRPTPPPTEYRIAPGDSFWSIAAARVAARGGAEAAVAAYWDELVAANLARLPVPGQPDLLFAGDRIVLPPL